jgi:hypothetical protein
MIGIQYTASFGMICSSNMWNVKNSMAGRQLESSFTQICSKISNQISDTHNYWYLSIKKIKSKSFWINLLT